FFLAQYRAAESLSFRAKRPTAPRQRKRNHNRFSFTRNRGCRLGIRSNRTNGEPLFPLPSRSARRARLRLAVLSRHVETRSSSVTEFLVTTRRVGSWRRHG